MTQALPGDDLPTLVEKLEELNRLHATLSQVNRSIVRAEDPYALYRDVCRIAVESGAFGFAWIGLVGPAGEWVQAVARAGATGNMERVSLLGASEGDPCPIALAVDRRQPVIVTEIGDAADAAPWRKALAAVGMKSFGAFPLRMEGQVVGVLAVAADTASYFREAETRLLDEVAGDISFIMDVLRQKEKHSAAETRAHYLAHYDAQTGLPGRQLFVERLAAIRAKAADRELPVLAVTLRRYHSTLQVLGQGAGIALARAVVGRMEQLLPTTMVARLSESEFACILEGIEGLHQVEEMAWRIHATLNEAVPVDGHEVILDPFVGIALCPRDGEPDESLKAALLAATKAPVEAGGACRFYVAGMDSDSRERLDLEAALRRAVEREEFVLHYQPQVSLGSGNVVGAEALLRWQRPGKGLVQPKDFIFLLEESGLIVPVGEWVMREACRQARRWQEEGLPPIRMAVNLSARQFQEADVRVLVQNALGEAGLEPNWLELEITESLVLLNAEAVIHTLEQIKASGVTCALDDFGTGYSSLSYLRRLPVKRLKIDFSFVTHITSDPNDAAIVRAVVGMAHSLGISVIAEGVETEGQLGYLRGLGCEEIQGAYFSWPLPAHAFADLLRNTEGLVLGNGQERRDRLLLLVDDEPNVLSALRRALRRTDFKVLVASTAREAFELLASQPVGVIVCDQRMPEMTGTEFLRRAKELHPEAIRIVLSGYTDLNSVLDAVNRGAIYKFLPKPWDEEVLLDSLLDAFRLHEMMEDNRRLSSRVRELLADRTA